MLPLEANLPPTQFGTSAFPPRGGAARKKERASLAVRGCQEDEKQSERRRSFLVEMSGLSTHEKFLCRLTMSSLNLLRVISEQEGVPIEDPNARRIGDRFLKDELKREQNIEPAVVQWDDSESGVLQEAYNHGR